MEQTDENIFTRNVHTMFQRKSEIMKFGEMYPIISYILLLQADQNSTLYLK